MKQKVKIVLAFLLAAMLALAVFGCRDNERVTGELPEGYQPVVEGRVTVNYYIATTDADKRSVNDWVAAFEKKYPNCDVEAQLSNTGKTAVQAQIASSSVGDVFFLWETDAYNYAVTQEALMPLDSYLEAYEIDVSNIFSAIYDMGVVEGQLYMVMRDYNHIALMYNKGAVAAEGLVDPVELDKNGEWTWEKYREYCEKLTKDTDNDNTIDQIGGIMRFGYAPIYVPFLEGYGGRWYDTTNKKVTFISSDSGEESLVLRGVNEMVDTIRSGTVRYNNVTGVENGDAAATIKDTPELSSYSKLNVTTAIVFQEQQFPTFASQGKAYENANIEWDCVSFPALPVHKVGTGSTGFAVFNKTRNPDAAAALCLFLYTEEGQRAYNGQEGGSVPNVRSLADDTFWRVPFDDKSIDPENGIYYDAWISWPEADTYGQIECVLPPEIAQIVKNTMQNVVPYAVNGTRTVADTLTRLEQQANDAWSLIING